LRACSGPQGLKAQAVFLVRLINSPITRLGSLNVRNFVVGLLLLSTAPAWAQEGQAEYALRVQREQCAAQVKSHQISTATDFVTCTNVAMRQYAVTVQFPWMDLQDVNEAQHLANAQNFDLRRITPDEWSATDKKIDADFTTSVNQRVAAETQIRTAQSAERQRRANAYLWLSQRLLNPPQPPPTTTTETTCMPFGTGFSCTTR
jgi:hypothetical protein